MSVFRFPEKTGKNDRCAIFEFSPRRVGVLLQTHDLKKVKRIKGERKKQKRNEKQCRKETTQPKKDCSDQRK
jgi:hypothetical protein